MTCRTDSARAEATRAAFWTPANLRLVTGGRWLEPPADPTAAIAGVTMDSRAIDAGMAFLAMPGEHVDGHDFVDAAFQQGAALAIVTDAQRPYQPPAGQGVLLVNDAVAALQQAAGIYRDLLAAAGTRVVAVAGSNGKTTTRHIIHGLLSGRMIAPDTAPTPGDDHARPETWHMKQLRGTQAPGSFNNHLGLPLTLLAADPGDDFVVCEIGTNHPGEVASLAAICRPDAAVLTAIGREHMEFFLTLDGVAREQAAMLEHLRPGGLIVAEHQAWHAVRPHASPPANHRLSTYGRAGQGSVQLLDVEQTPEGLTFSARFGDQSEPLTELMLPMLGEHNAVNALAALAVARWMGVDRIQTHLGLLSVAPVPGRCEPRAYGSGVTVIHDAYNANPDSMAAALDLLVSLDATRRVAVLGDMLELGDVGPEAHRAVGEWLVEHRSSIARFVLVGRLAMFVAEPLQKAGLAGRVLLLPEADSATAGRFAAALQPADLVLLKGSRGVRLERLLPAIEARFGPAA